MSQNKLHVKKGDTVIVLSGKNKGDKGKVISALPKKDKVIVEGVNKIKRHTKPNQSAPQGGIIAKEAPVHVSNVMLVCPHCSKATRIAKKEVNGKMLRACKKCNEVVDK